MICADLYNAPGLFWGKPGLIERETWLKIKLFRLNREPPKSGDFFMGVCVYACMLTLLWRIDAVGVSCMMDLNGKFHVVKV